MPSIDDGTVYDDDDEGIDYTMVRDGRLSQVVAGWQATCIFSLLLKHKILHIVAISGQHFGNDLLQVVTTCVVIVWAFAEKTTVIKI